MHRTVRAAPPRSAADSVRAVSTETALPSVRLISAEVWPCATTGDPSTARPTSSGSLRWLGIADDASYVGEPECNGCAERWIKTLKEQCLWARLYDDVDDLRQAVATFINTYNNEWLIQRHGHQTPREKYLASLSTEAA